MIMESSSTTLFQVAEIELSYCTKVKASDRTSISTSSDCYKLLLRSWDENKINYMYPQTLQILFCIIQ